MEARTSILRTTDDRARPRYLVPEPRVRGRPSRPHSVVIEEEEDAVAARNDGLPVFPLTSGIPTSLGYPISFPLRVLVSSDFVGAVRTKLEPIIFRQREAVRDPRFIDIVLAMLSVDTLAARALLERNPELIDRDYLLKRVLQEDLEQPATLVRFQDFAPSIPLVGTPLGKEVLARHMTKNVPRLVL